MGRWTKNYHWAYMYSLDHFSRMNLTTHRDLWEVKIASEMTYKEEKTTEEFDVLEILHLFLFIPLYSRQLLLVYN